MRNSFYIIGIAVIVLFAIMALLRWKGRETKEPEGRPLAKTIAKFDRTILDLGDVKQYSSIHGSYVLRNIGEKGLLIESVRTNCSCTSSAFSKGLIKAKDSTIVTIGYDSTRLGVFQSTGVVTSNGSEEPVVLILRGNVMGTR